jgi:hypothetical protein
MIGTMAKFVTAKMIQVRYPMLAKAMGVIKTILKIVSRMSLDGRSGVSLHKVDQPVAESTESIGWTAYSQRHDFHLI